MEREEIQIGNTTFFVQKFSAMRQLEIFGDLQKTLLPSFGKLLNGFGKNKEDDEKAAEESEKAFLDGLKSLSSQLDGKSLIALANQLILPDYVAFVRDDFNNGNDSKLSKDKFDYAFDEMGDLVELVIFILKLNFSSFFTKYLTRLGSVRE
ncbi:phage tail assembly chaperone [Mannheimia bovis]|uniref:Uncharacterized protein n=1 Tax=Mannheimia bovis TaxID=2770636 RepID=A0A7H1C0R7_9PAST|nr:hypothetical protein [Mannheimia bovis]QNS14572.1 hypothetical protein ICJ55_07340 [Mannheimia bovis]